LTSFLRVPLAMNVAQILVIDLISDIIPALGLGMEEPDPEVMARPPISRNKPLADKSLFLRSIVWLGMVETGLAYLGFYLVYYFYQTAPQLSSAIFAINPLHFWVGNEKWDIHVIASAVFFSGLILAQVGNAYACRTEKTPVHKIGWIKNRFLLTGIGMEIVITVMLLYVKPLAEITGNLPIPPIFWLVIICYVPIIYILERFRKNIFRKRTPERKECA